MKIEYVCDACGTRFFNRESCEAHEEEHRHNWKTYGSLVPKHSIGDLLVVSDSEDKKVYEVKQVFVNTRDLSNPFIEYMFLDDEGKEFFMEEDEKKLERFIDDRGLVSFTMKFDQYLNEAEERFANV